MRTCSYSRSRGRSRSVWPNLNALYVETGLEPTLTERASQRLYEGFKAVTFPVVSGTHDCLFRFPQKQDEVAELVSNAISTELADSLPHNLRIWVLSARSYALNLIEEGDNLEMIVPPDELGFFPTGKPLPDSIRLEGRQVFGVILAHFVHCYLQPLEKLSGFLRIVASGSEVAFLVPVYGLLGLCCNSLIGEADPRCLDRVIREDVEAVEICAVCGKTRAPSP